MQDISWIDMLDIRGSYGLAGNVDQTSTPYLTASRGTQDLYTSSSVSTVTIGTPPNPLLRWEKTASYDLGIDFAFLQGMLNGKIDLYYKKSDDLFTTIEVPFVSGYTTQKVNGGAMTNKGVEFTVSSPWFNRNGWTLTSTFMVSYNKNAVTKANFAATQAGQLINGTYYTEGNPLKSIYAYRYGGLTNGNANDYQNAVPIIYRADGTTMHTLNSDGTVTVAESSTMLAKDVYYAGPSTPPVMGSFTQGVKYKGLELSVMLLYYGGHKVYRPSFELYQPAATNDITDWMAKSWNPVTNRSSDIPKALAFYDTKVNTSNMVGLSGMYRKSDYNVASGNFMRLRNLNLSYTLPNKYTKILHLQKVKVSGQANNIWFWSSMGEGIDPETSSTGDWAIPTQASYLLRVDIVF